MTQLLVLAFVAGVAIGGFLGLVAGRRFARATRRAPPSDSLDAVPLADSLFPAEANFDAMAKSLVERCANRVQLPCALIMRDREGAAPFVVQISGGLDHRLMDVMIEMTGPAAQAILENVPVVGPPDEPLIQAMRRDRRRPINGGIAVPVGQGQPRGAVLAFGTPVNVTDAVHGLTALVRIHEAPLAMAHSVWVAQRRADTDELTGLPNRRALVGMKARGPGERAALVLLDIDHFKRINDTFGHAAGDAALKQIARELRETIRAGDVAVRIGGEEFAVWLPGADLATAMEVAERLRARVEREPFRCQGEALSLTISCGVSAYPETTAVPDNLMETADAALYQAKHAGRNRVLAARDGRSRNRV